MLLLLPQPLVFLALIICHLLLLIEEISRVSLLSKVKRWWVVWNLRYLPICSIAIE